MSELAPRAPAPVASREDLLRPFRDSERRGRPRRIGVELELALVRARDLAPVALSGPASIERLFAALRARGWRPTSGSTETRATSGSAAPTAPGFVFGLGREAGAERITLEPGGQVELVTAPLAGAAALVAQLRALLAELTHEAAREGLLVLGGGLQPFAREDELLSLPRARWEALRERFAALGASGRLGAAMMAKTLSLQASFDWDDEMDGARLLAAALRAAPALAALAAASPIEERRVTGFASRRLAIWRATDPSRTGFVAPCLEPGAGYEAWLEYALSVPLLLRVSGGRYAAVPRGSGTFRDLLAAGHFPTGERPTLADWEAHLSSIFTHARWKTNVIEVRALDGPLPGELAATVALLVGLFEAKREALHARLAHLDDARGAAPSGPPPSPPRGLRPLALPARSAPELEGALDTAARHGLGALAAEASALVALAREGLEARVAGGLEPEGTPDLLRPIERRLAAGESPAAELRRAFERSGPEGLAALLAYEEQRLARAAA